MDQDCPEIRICQSGFAWGYGHKGYWDGLIPNVNLIPDVVVPDKSDKQFKFENDPIYGKRLVES